MCRTGPGGTGRSYKKLIGAEAAAVISAGPGSAPTSVFHGATAPRARTLTTTAEDSASIRRRVVSVLADRFHARLRA